MQDTPESTINSISEFLHAAGTQFRIVDMGRGYRELSAQTFVDIEYQKQPVPYPRQQHMWFGCIFWQSGQHYIWFLKLPLDERGLLNLLLASLLLEKVVQALGAQLENTSEKMVNLATTFYIYAEPKASCRLSRICQKILSNQPVNIWPRV